MVDVDRLESDVSGYAAEFNTIARIINQESGWGETGYVPYKIMQSVLDPRSGYDTWDKLAILQALSEEDTTLFLGKVEENITTFENIRAALRPGEPVVRWETDDRGRIGSVEIYMVGAEIDPDSIIIEPKFRNETALLLPLESILPERYESQGLVITASDLLDAFLSADSIERTDFTTPAIGLAIGRDAVDAFSMKTGFLQAKTA